MSPIDSVHTLAELARWSFSGTALAVLGHPIEHSLSPAMHNAALAQMSRDQGKFAEWRYYKFDVSPAALPVSAGGLAGDIGVITALVLAPVGLG